MSRSRLAMLVVTLGGAAFVLGACATSGGIPRVVADAEPFPNCPPSICPQHTPTQPPPPDEPDPEPTATGPKSTKKPQPKPSKTSPGVTVPGTTPTPGATATVPGVAPLPSVAPGKSRFAAFPFGDLPYDQAFPKEAPPPPEPLPLPPSTVMVGVAALLAAGVAAATSMTARRQAWRTGTVVPRGGSA